MAPYKAWNYAIPLSPIPNLLKVSISVMPDNFSLRILSLFLVFAAIPGCAPPVPLERDLLIATATTGGTFYPVGVAIATLVSRDDTLDEPILASAITSSGSAENIAMLINGEVQMGIIQSLFASMAWQGSGFYENRPVENLRGMTMLWENVEQVVVARRLVSDGTIEDLKNRSNERISMGPRWSGSEVSASTIMEVLGIETGIDFGVAHLGYGPSADAMMNRRIAGMFLGAGIPTGAIIQAYAGMGNDNVAMLSFSDEQLSRLREFYPVWNRFVIPANTYPGQSNPVETLAQPNVLVTHADTDEEVIYQVLRILWENLDYLQRQHAATRSMSIEHATSGMPLPLHPGAVHFYRDAGLEIPATLISPEFKQ